MIYFIIGAIALILLTQSSKTMPSKTVISKVELLFTDVVQNALLQCNSSLSVNDVIPLICVESGSFILKDIPNNQIIGDLGLAVGYMQLHKGAFTDANNYLGTGYIYNDVKNSGEINILIGTTYFTMCYNKALSEDSVNPLNLAVRKYNQGIGTPHDSNTIGESYLQIYLGFKALL